MLEIANMHQPVGAEIGINMTNKRAMEVLKNVVDYVAVANNTSSQIEELLKYGFEGIELVNDFGYSKADVEAVTGEELPTPVTDDFMNPPEYDSHEIATTIKDLLDHNELTSGDISVVFRALHRQENCIGGKIWSHYDIRSQLRDNYNVDLSDDAVAIIADNINDTLDDCHDAEWMAIDEAIRTSDIKIKVTDIDWDVDKNDFDNEAEYDAVNENLPKEVEIPLSELEGNVEIEDYLSDNYDYCVKSFKTEEVAA